MRILVLGRGKTGSLVATIAAEHGHSVRVLDEAQNHNGMALTPPLLAQFEAIQNMRACLSTGAKMVVGTTGWYDQLPEMRTIAERRSAALLYGANFSFGMQILFRLAETLREQAHGYQLSIEETHHTTKLDTPSGTALSLQQILRSVQPDSSVEITSNRVEEVLGEHVVTARSADDVLTLRHQANSRRAFADGAVRGAEWLVKRTGCYDFHEVFAEIYA